MGKQGHNKLVISHIKVVGKQRVTTMEYDIIIHQIRLRGGCQKSDKLIFWQPCSCYWSSVKIIQKNHLSL